MFCCCPTTRSASNTRNSTHDKTCRLLPRCHKQKIDSHSQALHLTPCLCFVSSHSLITGHDTSILTFGSHVDSLAGYRGRNPHHFDSHPSSRSLPDFLRSVSLLRSLHPTPSAASSHYDALWPPWSLRSCIRCLLVSLCERRQIGQEFDCGFRMLLYLPEKNTFYPNESKMKKHRRCRSCSSIGRR